jgi:hypothetical protein
MLASFMPPLAHLALLAMVAHQEGVKEGIVCWPQHCHTGAATQTRQSRPEDGRSERDSGRALAGDSRQSEALRQVTEHHPELGPKQNKGHVFTALFCVYARDRLSVLRE